MEHFYRDIQGWSTYTPFYQNAVRDAPEAGAHFVEIGSWKGRSAAFMAVEIINSGKQIRFDAVDPWSDGGPDLRHKTRGWTRDALFETFLRNIRPVRPFVTPIRLPSLEAVTRYQDGSLDFVLIDGSHVYEDVVQDIRAWAPKVKPGGVLAGDDYAWPGVRQACDEVFGRVVADGPANQHARKRGDKHSCWRVRRRMEGDPLSPETWEDYRG